MDTGITGYETLQGNKGVELLRSEEEEYAFFTVMTFWSSFGEKKIYVGDDIEKAKYYPEVELYLVDIKYAVEYHNLSYSEY
ncbi:hypothetical protein [Pseudomonas sp. Leaf129]|uniref:hypothetical protein n=1 Tax=Pseudomonas sp. Leaf129 TaxID=1736268 RepID=UPI000A49094D|nr:hypothetical protein [Pseudomonas sp. Leaf129]